MTKRDQWRKVLDAEVARWSAMSCAHLLTELREIQVYEVALESKRYQVEVEILENTEQYVNVAIAVDDGSLPASLSPETRAFLCKKAV